MLYYQISFTLVEVTFPSQGLGAGFNALSWPMGAVLGGRGRGRGGWSPTLAGRGSNPCSGFVSLPGIGGRASRLSLW